MGAGTTDWVATTLPLQPGEAVMLTVSANALRHAAMRGYGLIALAAVVGAAVGSVAGDRWHAANAGAALGLWLGTLLAARWTKRHPLPVSVQRMDAR
jgi:positive regulator of sigma E activity